MVSGCIPFWRLQGSLCLLAHLGCWQNLVPYIFRIETPFPCWLSAMCCSQLLEATLILCLMNLFLHLPGNGRSSHFLYLFSSAFHLISMTQKKKFSFFKDSCDQLWPTLIIKDKVLFSNTSIKYLLSYQLTYAQRMGIFRGYNSASYIRVS